MEYRKHGRVRQLATNNVKPFPMKYVSLSLLTLFLGVCGFALLFFSRSASTSCFVKNEAELPDVKGFHIQVISASCDTFSKDLSFSVLIAKDGTKEKDVLFKYWPDTKNPLPTVAGLPGQRLLISIPSVISIYSQVHQWHATTIDYDIGSVAYPNENATK
jgi:hypothetical protein